MSVNEYGQTVYRHPSGVETLVSGQWVNDPSHGDERNMWQSFPEWEADKPVAPEPQAPSGGGSSVGGGSAAASTSARSGAGVLDEMMAKYPKPGGYTPETVKINPATDTVLGRLYSMLHTDSPFLKAARQRAVEYAHRRGLQNSSLAAGAGERAATEAASPVAQADAEASLNTKFFNVDAQNRAKALQYQEANANWRHTQSLALGYYEVDAANARQQQSISASLQMQQNSIAANIKLWELNTLSQINSASGYTGPQQVSASERVRATAAAELAWVDNWAGWA